MSLASMPKVPWTTKLAARAEDQIRARLNHFSDVTKLTPDLAVDFYCELLENRAPFYVQAKGTRRFKGTWSQGIKTSTVRYWLTHPSPVMLIVYDEKADTCYWMSIQSRLYELLPQLRSDSKTIRITLDRSRVLAQGPNANGAFIAQIKEDQARIMLLMGYPQAKGEGYLRQIPDAPAYKFVLARVEENLRMTLYSLAMYYMHVSHDWPKARDSSEFLTKFDKSHYNQFAMLAQIQELQGDRPAALLNWKEALNICERDKTSPREWIEGLKKAIKREIERIESSLQAGTSN